MTKKLIDASGDLLIAKHKNGIMLIRPDDKLQFGPKKRQHSIIMTVADLLDLPLSIQFIDANSLILNINTLAIETYGYSSFKEVVGKTVTIATGKRTADFLMKSDQELVKTQQRITWEVPFIRLDSHEFMSITTKIPWYNDNDSIIGILIISVALSSLNPNSMLKGLSLMAELGLLSESFNQANSSNLLFHGAINNGIYLSKRERECVSLISKGMTIKAAARVLNLSQRTVEHYLENVRGKFNVHSKSELIAKISAIEVGKNKFFGE